MVVYFGKCQKGVSREEVRGVKIRKVPSKSKIVILRYWDLVDRRSKSVKPDATDHLLGNRVELEL